MFVFLQRLAVSHVTRRCRQVRLWPLPLFCLCFTPHLGSWILFLFFCSDLKVNMMSLTILGLRVLFVKTVAFNVLMTLKLWLRRCEAKTHSHFDLIIKAHYSWYSSWFCFSEMLQSLSAVQLSLGRLLFISCVSFYIWALAFYSSLHHDLFLYYTTIKSFKSSHVFFILFSSTGASFRRHFFMSSENTRVHTDSRS